MRKADIQYKKIVLVCVNERQVGSASCANKLSLELYNKIKIKIAEADPEVRVSKTGCLGNCLSGATIAIMPDNVYLGEVKEKDIPEIISIVNQ
jgi:(2Fe-2S) ferredoxin